MSNTHSIPSVASFDANPPHTLPEEILNPLSDELEAADVFIDRLRRHAVAVPYDDQPDELTQVELLAHVVAIEKIVDGLHQRVESLREPHGKVSEIYLELTKSEADDLKRLAAELDMDAGMAAVRLIMSEVQRRFGLSEEPKKAA